MPISLGLGKSIAAVVGVVAVGAAGYSMVSGNCLLSACGLTDKGEANIVAASSETDAAGCCPLSNTAETTEVTLASADMTESSESATSCSEMAAEKSCSEAVTECSEMVAEKTCSEAATACSGESDNAAVTTVAMDTAKTGSECSAEAMAACADKGACDPSDCSPADCDKPCGEAEAAAPASETEISESTEG